MNLTPRTPKYSLMMSVMMNTTGHSTTPVVNDSEPDCPNSRVGRWAIEAMPTA